MVFRELTAYSNVTHITRAHKAANPANYQIPERSKQLYPPLQKLRLQDIKPTSVHHQVYDGESHSSTWISIWLNLSGAADVPHVLPILFAFTTPAKFCFRSMANFAKFVTNIPSQPLSTILNGPIVASPAGSNDNIKKASGSTGVHRSMSLAPPSDGRPSLSRRLSQRMSRASSLVLRKRSSSPLPKIRPSTAGGALDGSGSELKTPTRKGSFFSEAERQVGSPAPMVETSPAESAVNIVSGEGEGENGCLLGKGEVDVGQGEKKVASGELVDNAEVKETAATPLVVPVGANVHESMMPPTKAAQGEEQLTTDSDVGGKRFNLSSPPASVSGEKYAGQADAYSHIKVRGAAPRPFDLCSRCFRTRGTGIAA